MLALSLVFTSLAAAVFAAPTPSRTVQKREPHLPVLTLPTPGTQIYVMVDAGASDPAGYFEFAVIMTDGENEAEFARVMLQNSTGAYQVGDNIPVYNSWTYEAIVNSTLSVIAPGDYVLQVQEDKPSGGWATAISTNVSVYSEICGTDPTCCWWCTSD